MHLKLTIFKLGLCIGMVLGKDIPVLKEAKPVISIPFLAHLYVSSGFAK